MPGNSREIILGPDAVLKGDIKNARRAEVHGYVEGNVAAETLVVQDGGRLYGKIDAQTAEIKGEVQGEVRVRNLISIKPGGLVSGNVKYGRIAMDQGAELIATVRNVPPTISGDLDLIVTRGKTVKIMPSDLTALDPDDKPDQIKFDVTQADGGFLMLASAPGVRIETFTQADIEAGRVLFAHKGGPGATARFDVVAADRAGAKSGKPQTVQVRVR